MNKIILICLLFFSMPILAQNGFEDWDINYKLSDAEEIIEKEALYAKKVESDTSVAQYYVAMNKIRFLAKYTGEKREVGPETITSLKNVFKLKVGNTEVLDGLISEELLFLVGDSKIWMPIQNVLIDDFQQEVNLEDEVLLYCLFTNEHKLKGGVINTFLISEFTTTWD